MSILLIVLGGLLLGGAISVRQQGGGRVPVVILGLLSCLAVAGGVLWMVD
jgi:hypothetical protein